MSLLERVNNARQSWMLLLPSCPCPDDHQLARWASCFADAELEYAFRRVAAKVDKGLPADVSRTGRYCTGVLVNQRRGGLNGQKYTQVHGT